MKHAYILAACLLVACQQIQLADDSQQSATNPKANGTGIGGVNTYSISSTWAAPQWTFKGDFNGDKHSDLATILGAEVLVNYAPNDGGQIYSTVPWPIHNIINSNPRFTWSGDFNGDGFTDFATLAGPHIDLILNNREGRFTSTILPVANLWGSGGHAVAGDFNGDKRTDIVSFLLKDSNMTLMLPSPTDNLQVAAVESANWVTDGLFGANGWTFALDVNGDGLDDVVSVNGTQLYLKKSTGTSFDCSVYQTSPKWGAQAFTWTGDTDGDGLEEIITAIGNTLYVREWDMVANNVGTSTVLTSAVWGRAGKGPWRHYSYNFVQDVNGDGRDEIVSLVGDRVYLH